MIGIKRAVFFGLVAAAALTAFAAQETFNLRVNPAKDQVFKYKNTGVLTVMGMDVKAEYTSTMKIADITATSFTTEAGDVKGSIDMMGQIVEMPDMGLVKTTYGLNGAVTKIDGEQGTPEAYRSANLMTIFRPETPVSVGQEWTWTPAANTELGTKAMEAKYKVEAIETILEIKTLKITIDAKETAGDLPASAKGSMWVCALTGIPVKMDMEVKNLPFPGAPEPLSGKMQQILVKS
jgi:hypothetical protein